MIFAFIHLLNVVTLNDDDIPVHIFHSVFYGFYTLAVKATSSPVLFR